MKSSLRRIVLISGLLAAALMVVPAGGLLPRVQTAEAAPDQAMIDGFPSVAQWYNLDCEYAASAAITLFWGNLVSQSVFMAEVPQNANPHLGFRGDINGTGGGIDDYGIYAEPLAKVLEAHGYNAVVFYGGVSRLKANVAAGNPVQVWITTGKYTERTATREMLDGNSFKLVPSEHSVVVYGYDSYGVYLMDVGDGGFYHTDWDSFTRRWGYFDEMSLVIMPQ